jgi:hypothetical protein
LRTPSLQLGGAHAPCVLHEPVTQSDPTLQGNPTLQGAQAPPPQSTPVSAPSRRVSVQLSGVQREVSLAQKVPGSQSMSCSHAASAEQRCSQLPPQSTPVSSPFWTRSSQLGWSCTGGGEQSEPTQPPASGEAAGGAAHTPARQTVAPAQGTASQHATPPAQRGGSLPASGVSV